MDEKPRVGGDSLVTEYRPETIPIYWLQESELLVISKNADTLPQQLSIAAWSAAIGAAPGALSAVIQLGNSNTRPDLANLAALFISLAGIVMGILFAWVHRRGQYYPQQLLKEILARKEKAEAGPDRSSTARA